MATLDPTAPEAQSPSVPQSVIAEALELRRLIKSILSADPPVAVAAAPGTGHEPECHPNDRTDNRIRAYLASLCRLRGVATYRDDIEDAHRRARALIERLALSAAGSDAPALRLTPDQVADVLSLMSSLEPIEPETWWRDGPEDEPSRVCGFYLLLSALAEALRSAGSASEPQGTDGEPQATDEALAGVVRLLRSAARLFDGHGDADMDLVGELVNSASGRLKEWLRKITSQDGSGAFDALDACTAVAALIEAGLDPRNGKTISPIRGILWMAVERLEEAESPPSESQNAADPEAHAAIRRLMHRLDVASDKLALVAHCEDWSNPSTLLAGQLGQVAIVREVSKEFTDVYCALGEWLGQHAGVADGPWVENFEEGSQP